VAKEILKISVPCLEFLTPNLVRMYYLFFHSFIRQFIAQSVLRQVHKPFQSQLSTQCDLLFPYSSSNILSFP
jgi:hypothetical protein